MLGRPLFSGAPTKPKNTHHRVPICRRLKPYSGDARIHRPKQIAEIASNIKAFGFDNPFLISQADTIIAAYGRVEAAYRFGHETVPVIRLENLYGARQRACILTDNKPAQ